MRKIRDDSREWLWMLRQFSKRLKENKADDVENALTALVNFQDGLIKQLLRSKLGRVDDGQINNKIREILETEELDRQIARATAIANTRDADLKDAGIVLKALESDRQNNKTSFETARAMERARGLDDLIGSPARYIWNPKPSSQFRVIVRHKYKGKQKGLMRVEVHGMILDHENGKAQNTFHGPT